MVILEEKHGESHETEQMRGRGRENRGQMCICLLGKTKELSVRRVTDRARALVSFA